MSNPASPEARRASQLGDVSFSAPGAEAASREQAQSAFAYCRERGAAGARGRSDFDRALSAGWLIGAEIGGATALIQACRGAQPSIVSALLRAGADPNWAPLGETPLIAAAKAASATDCLMQLLRRGADPSAVDPTGRTALHWAALADDRKKIEGLARASAAIDARDEAGMTPLALALQEGKTSAYGELWRKGADPKIPCADGRTTLILAAKRCQTATMRELLERGVDPLARGPDGATALDALKSARFFGQSFHDQRAVDMLVAAMARAEAELIGREIGGSAASAPPRARSL